MSPITEIFVIGEEVEKILRGYLTQKQKKRLRVLRNRLLKLGRVFEVR